MNILNLKLHYERDKDYQAIRYFSLNEKGRDFVVGDIHGMYTLLMDALKAVEFDMNKDRLFCVGDFFDRGPECHKMIEFIEWLERHGGGTVIGNHDDLVLSTIAYNERTDPDECSDGYQWIAYQDDEWRQKAFKKLRTLPVAIEIETNIGKIGIVHAGIPIGMHWSVFKKEINNIPLPNSLYNKTIWDWDRNKLKIETVVDGVERIFVGHCDDENVRIYGNVYHVDTGAVYKFLGEKRGHLTIADITANNESFLKPTKKGMIAVVKAAQLDESLEYAKP